MLNLLKNLFGGDEKKEIGKQTGTPDLSTTIIEMDFYNDFAILGKDEQQCLIEELQHFIQGINPYPIFINNVSCILAGEWGAFGNLALRIIDYLKYVAENENEKLNDLYIKMKDIMNCKKTV